MFQNGNNRLFLQFARFENVFKVLCDGRSLNTEELRRRLLGHPEILVTENDLDALLAFRRFVENQFVRHDGKREAVVFCL